MEAMLAVGLASAALGVAHLAWRRRLRGRLLVLAGIGWALFFVGLAAAFQVLPYGPQLFLVGCIVGAIIQYVADAARRRMSVGEEQPNGRRA